MANENIRAFKGKNSFKFRTEWKIFAWCFLIASILWLLTALNELYTSSLIIKARYLNYPKDKAFVKPLPEDFKVMVTAKGWDLMSHYFRKNPYFITIDLNEYRKTDVLVTRRLQDNFEQAIARKITIGEVFPETISLLREEKATKKVPVRFNQEIICKKQFGLGDEIRFSPDSVTISGPYSIIKSIDHIDAEGPGIKDIDKEQQIEVKLKEPEAKNVSLSSNKILVKLPVFQLTEQIANVPVEVINGSSNNSMILIPPRISVIYQTPINRFSKGDSVQFQAIVDCSQIDSIIKQPLKVQLISSPRFTYNIRLKPDYIEYVIEK